MAVPNGRTAQDFLAKMVLWAVPKRIQTIEVGSKQMEKRTFRVGLPRKQDLEPGSKQWDGGSKSQNRVGLPRQNCLLDNSKAVPNNHSRQRRYDKKRPNFNHAHGQNYITQNMRGRGEGEEARRGLHARLSAAEPWPAH